jgi:hypothetical protein
MREVRKKCRKEQGARSKEQGARSKEKNTLMAFLKDF